MENVKLFIFLNTNVIRVINAPLNYELFRLQNKFIILQ